MEPAVYPASALEQAMKGQEVMLRAIDGRLKWYQAAEILAISDRQMRRLKQRYERWDYDGLFDQRGVPRPICFLPSGGSAPARPRPGSIVRYCWVGRLPA